MPSEFHSEFIEVSLLIAISRSLRHSNARGDFNDLADKGADRWNSDLADMGAAEEEAEANHCVSDLSRSRLSSDENLSRSKLSSDATEVSSGVPGPTGSAESCSSAGTLLGRRRAGTRGEHLGVDPLGARGAATSL